MYSDNEMMLYQLMQYEEDAAAYDEEKLLIMVALLCLCLRAKINVPPRRGGSRLGKKRNKDRQRMNVVVVIESDYFANIAMHAPIEFLAALQDEQRLLMKILIGVWEYDD
jgi:hypothetical protein